MGYPTQQQKVDYLFKKIGFTKTKTGVAEDQTSGFSGDTKKAPPNEAIASPLIIPGSSVWSDSSFITATPPTSSTAYVGTYTTATAYRMTVDTTVANERTFIARQTWGNPSSAIDGDWIDTQFGADYLVKVYLGDPSTGVPGVAYTNLSAAGTSGKDDVWFFDYSSGVLNFNGADLDGQLAGISTDNVYLVGYRYIGRKGIQPPAGIGTFHDLVVSNNLSVGGISTFEKQHKKLIKNPRFVSPFFIPSMISDIAPGHISIKYNLKGPNSSPVTACATGTHAKGDSFTLIKNGKADLMVCGGAEAAICPLGIAGFSAARALCDTFNDNPTKGS